MQRNTFPLRNVISISTHSKWIVPEPQMLTIPMYEEWVFKIQDIRIIIRRDDVDGEKCPGISDLVKFPDNCSIGDLYRKCSHELSLHVDHIVVLDGRANKVPFDSHLTIGQVRNTYCH